MGSQRKKERERKRKRKIDENGSTILYITAQPCRHSWRRKGDRRRVVRKGKEEESEKGEGREIGELEERKRRRI